ncbi:hypothetical protein IHN63_00360 [Deinococcus sp. 6YEL10]|uniref:hypothetical protein n=1 Tax=Deinococcus sp. 6YEL10 TaxID=2745870 RepID=UPI001E2939EF|nr:hypothetical protein [Deinococcus sp. 6YEL10]MCD0159751.1 hypothetical protein [Deinococcus sp. 6YEL10]
MRVLLTLALASLSGAHAAAYTAFNTQMLRSLGAASTTCSAQSRSPLGDHRCAVMGQDSFSVLRNQINSYMTYRGLRFCADQWDFDGHTYWGIYCKGKVAAVGIYIAPPHTSGNGQTTLMLYTESRSSP